MPPNIFLSISYSLLNLFDGAILLQDERLLVNQLEQLIQQFSRLAGLAKTKSAKLMLTEQGIFSAKQSANIQQITPLVPTHSHQQIYDTWKSHLLRQDAAILSSFCQSLPFNYDSSNQDIGFCRPSFFLVVILRKMFISLLLHKFFSCKIMPKT